MVFKAWQRMSVFRCMVANGGLCRRIRCLRINFISLDLCAELPIFMVCQADCVKRIALVFSINIT